MLSVNNKNGCGMLYRTRRGGRVESLLAGFPTATALAVAATATAALRLEPDGTAVVHRNGLGREGELLFARHD